MGGHSLVNSEKLMENKVLLQTYMLENVNMTWFFSHISQSIRVINVTFCYTAYSA